MGMPSYVVVTSVACSGASSGSFLESSTGAFSLLIGVSYALTDSSYTLIGSSSPLVSSIGSGFSFKGLVHYFLYFLESFSATRFAVKVNSLRIC
jgi:hypothetical protein